ncbi:MAG: hypothetical protein JWL64_2471 [Frankiales bacterium]|nr:hypothetical protein [Frankiales bacterium]
MVDFRYHLVSIVAVFLALALGIVVGTTQLNGAVLDDLNDRINGLTSDKRGLEQDISDAKAQTAADQKLAEQIAPLAVTGQLTGRVIVLVSAPNAPSGLREGLVPLLEEAGATVATQIRLRPDLVDPTKTREILAVVDAQSPPGQDRTGTPVQQAARQLAAALFTSDGLGDPAASAMLNAYQDGDLIDVDGEPKARGTLAIVLTGEPVKGTDAKGTQARIDSLLEMARALDEAGQGVVVAGPESSAESGGALATLRDDNDVASEVSSVDGIDKPQGRLAIVFALREQIQGEAGQYGTGPKNDGPVPQPLTR